jgi:hypothetical protein
LQSGGVDIIPWPNGGLVKNIHDGDCYCNSSITRWFCKKVGVLVNIEGIFKKNIAERVVDHACLWVQEFALHHPLLFSCTN